jgi:hypothetical protein
MSELIKQEKEPKKLKPRKPLPPLITSAGANEMPEVNYLGRVENSPTNWGDLPRYALFSGSADGSYPLLKISKTQYVDLRTGKSQWCGSGRCYRVLL